MIGEKALSFSKSVGKETPEPLTGNFRTRASESGDRAARMFEFRFGNRAFNSEPIANGADLAKRNAGLDHSKGPGIHAEKENSFLTVAKFSEIEFVTGPCIYQWIVNVGYGRGKLETVDVGSQAARRGQEVSADAAIY